jgi:hypothetical protein
LDNYAIVKTNHPTRWRFFSQANDGEAMEIVLRVQGIISKKELPPLNHEKYFMLFLYYYTIVINCCLIYSKKIKQDAKYLRQGVQITGLGSDSFKGCIDGIQAAFTKFSRQFKEDQLQVWRPDSFMTYQAINIYNRYFYPARDIDIHARAPFGDGIDPNNVLSVIGRANSLIHTLDNQVEYFKMSSDKK